MAEEIPAASGVHIGGTILAILVAPIVLLITAAIVGGLWALLNVATTVIRPGIIGFFAAIIGGWGGLYAARAACDAVLRSYSRRTVYVELTLLSLAGLAFELTLPFGWQRIAPIAQLLTIAGGSWGLFRRGDKI